MSVNAQDNLIKALQTILLSQHECVCVCMPECVCVCVDSLVTVRQARWRRNPESTGFNVFKQPEVLGSVT